MAKNYAPDGWNEYLSTWGVDVDEASALTNVIGPTYIHFKNTTPASYPVGLVSDYIPVEGGSVYLIHYIAQSDSSAAANKLYVQLFVYNGSKSYIATHPIRSSALPSAGVWYNEKKSVIINSSARYARLLIGKTNTAFNAYFDYATFTRARPGFSAYATGGTINTSSWTKVPCSTEEYDYGSVWDTTNRRCTAPRDRVWHFEAVVGISSLADGDRIEIGWYKNGALDKYGATHVCGGAHDPRINASLTTELMSGDYVELYAWQNSGFTKSFNTSNNTTRIAGWELD